MVLTKLPPICSSEHASSCCTTLQPPWLASQRVLLAVVCSTVRAAQASFGSSPQDEKFEGHCFSQPWAALPIPWSNQQLNRASCIWKTTTIDDSPLFASSTYAKTLVLEEFFSDEEGRLVEISSQDSLARLSENFSTAAEMEHHSHVSVNMMSQHRMQTPSASLARLTSHS